MHPPRLLPAVGLTFAGIALFATIWTVLPAPTYALWLLSVAATEWSIYFGLAGVVAAVLGGAAYRKGARRSGACAMALGVATFVLSLLPLLSVLPVAERNGVSLSLPTYFGLSNNPNDLAVSKETIPYTVADGQTLHLDRYWRNGQPAHAMAKPAVVVVHGGSWSAGSRSDFAQWDRYLSDAGYVVFDIDYRLAPQPNWRSATADVQTAVAYVRARAVPFGVDPDRIALLGRSAGGHLALLAAYTAAPTSRVNAVVSLYGPTDLVWGYHHTAFPDVIDGKGTLRRFTGGTPHTLPDVYREASPILYVGPATVPTLLIHGGRDRIVGPQHSRMLADRLRAAGVPCELVIIPYALHGFDYNFEGWGSQVVRPVLMRFLRDAQKCVPVPPPPSGPGTMTNVN